MSKYVMSDIHGCYDAFLSMLDLIKFSDDDALCILGDIIDRGEKPLDIVDYIVKHPNISLIRGNHEELFMNYFISDDENLWYRNGGFTTHNELKNRGLEYEKNFYNYLKLLPLIRIVDGYILVHAGLDFPEDYNELSLNEFLSNQTEVTCLWGRDNIGHEKQYKDFTIICGHTPVQVIDENIKEMKDVKILHRKGTIYIDCGYCFGKEAGGKLACLRLDDMKEFYINSL